MSAASPHAATVLAAHWNTLATLGGTDRAYALVAALRHHPRTPAGLVAAGVEIDWPTGLQGLDVQDITLPYGAHVWTLWLTGGLPAAARAIRAVGDESPVNTIANLMARYGSDRDYELLVGV